MILFCICWALFVFVYNDEFLCALYINDVYHIQLIKRAFVLGNLVFILSLDTISVLPCPVL